MMASGLIALLLLPSAGERPVLDNDDSCWLRFPLEKQKSRRESLGDLNELCAVQRELFGLDEAPLSSH
jgi:hypothetical protein